MLPWFHINCSFVSYITYINLLKIYHDIFNKIIGIIHILVMTITINHNDKL